MSLELRQQLKLSQQLVMTPQLQQAIKLLQLSRVELLEVVQQELLENPLLEEVSFQEDEQVDSDNQHEERQKSTLSSEEQSLIKNADWENYLGEFASSSRHSSYQERENPEELQSYEARYSSKVSLQGHLLWQLQLQNFSASEVIIGEEIIGNLDSRGYLQATVQEIAASCRIEPELVEHVLKRIQFFDPIGVAARDIQECLLVQLESLEEDDPVLISLVRDHLEDIEKNRIAPLLKKFKLSKELMHEYIQVIRSLDPFPGSSFGSEDVIYISPDIYVYKHENDFVIMLNEEGFPSLQLSSCYAAGNAGNNSKANKREIEYIQEKTRSAIWLMKSLHQRQRTLYKVMQSILKFQKEFFRHGVSHLKPLILKEVAEDISMHESTVSRITTNKYVSTPYGIYELKFFFNSALNMEGGGHMGSESVKAAIKKMVVEEDPKRPHSDEAIAAILREKLDVNIARRTVAKYRMALNIPSSSKRKKYF